MSDATTLRAGRRLPDEHLRPTTAGAVVRAYGTVIRGKLMLIQSYQRRRDRAGRQGREGREVRRELELRIACLERGVDRALAARERATMACPELPEHRVMSSRRLQERLDRALADIHRALPTMTERERAEILARDLPLLAEDRRAFASMLEASLRGTLSVISNEGADAGGGGPVGGCRQWR